METNDNMGDEFFPENYDLEEIIDDKIQPLLKTIVNICSEYNIPMLSTFQYKNTEEKVMFCTTVVLPKARTSEKLLDTAKFILETELLNEDEFGLDFDADPDDG